MIYNLNKKSKKELVGNKAYHLTQLKMLGFNIPKGIVIPIDITEKILKKHKKTIIKKINNKKEIKTELDKVNFPDNLMKEILIHLKDFKNKKFSVRSSTNIEDSLNHSFAGLFDSYLHVKRSELKENITKCIKSLFSERMIGYSKRNRISLKDVSIAVIIQEMVYGDFSGIAFSKNPVNNNTNQIMIEIGKGGCEKFVSGKNTPNTYILEKESNNKKVLVEKEDIENINNYLNILKKAIIKLENKLESNVDIEFTFKSNELIMLQWRPITTN